MRITTRTTTTREYSTAPTDPEIYNRLLRQTDEMPTEIQLIAGRYPLGNVSLIASKSGVGKTWLIIGTLTDLSIGSGFFTNDTLTPFRKSILFCGETGIDLILERISRLRRKPDFSAFKLVSYTDAQQNGISLDLDTETGVGAVKNFIRVHKADIVCFDTLMSFHASDENSAQQTNLILANLQRISADENCAIIATHHLRKRSANGLEIPPEQDDIIGSTALVRRAANAFILSRNKHTGALRLENVKSWWKLSPPLDFKLIDTSDGIDFTNSEAWEGEKTQQKRIDEYLQAIPTGQAVTFKQISDACNATFGTIRNLISKYCRAVRIGDETIYIKK